MSLDTVLVYADGGARGNPGPAGIGAVILDPATDPPTELATVSEFIGHATNNVAEYRAVIEGLKAAERFAARRLILRADSKLVVEQLRGAWRVKQHHLVPLWREARSLLHRYDAVTLEHVGRALNTEADALVNAALDAQASRE